MTTRSVALGGLALGAIVLGPGSAAAQDEYRHGYVRHVEPGVTLQRATDVGAEEAVPNLPFLPGDRVWTDASGRAEFRFPDGSVVRLDGRSKLDYAGHDEGRDEAIVLRLWSGSLILRNRTGQLASFEVETPGGLVRVSDRGVFRIDVGEGETWLSSYEGWATLDTGRDRVEVGGGERAIAQWDGAASGPEPFDRYAGDDFARWDGDLEARDSWAASGRRYLPQELDPYAAELDTHGTWVHEPSAGYVWQPRVTASWVPYTNGYWAWTPVYGYSWVAYEPWGWAPFHYGRWGHSVSLGWYWSPGTVWGPGWVSWWVGGGHVGWCALGRHGRPITPWPHHRGHAVPRGSHGPKGHAVPRGWSFAHHDDLGRRDVARRRASVDAGVLAAGRIAETGAERPTRNGLALAASPAPLPAAASRRPRPHAAGRALPSTPPQAGGSVSRPRTTGPSTGTVAPGAARPGSGALRASPRTGNRTEPGQGNDPSPVPRVPGVGFSRPRSGSDGSSGGASRTEPSTAPEGRVPGVGFSRPRPGSESSADRPRTSNPRSSGSAARPREESSTFRPGVRSGSSASSRPSRSSGTVRSSSPSRSSTSRAGTSRPSSGSAVRSRPSSSRSSASRPSGISSRSSSSRPSGISSRSSSSRPSGSASRSSPPSRSSSGRSASRSSPPSRSSSSSGRATSRSSSSSRGGGSGSRGPSRRRE